MLEFLRKNAQGWFAWATLSAIIIPFALWGTNQYFSHESRPDVAKVNGQEITIKEFQQSYEQQRSRMQQSLGARFDASTFDDAKFKRDVLENLIAETVLSQKAEDEGLRIGDPRLGAEIRAIPALQKDGHFDKDQYMRLVRSQGLTVSGFEQLVRGDLAIEQLRRGVMDSGFATQEETDKLLALSQQQRDIGYMTVSAAPYLNTISVDDQGVARYYADHRDIYRVPEQVQVDYVELSVDQLAKTVPVSDQALHERYQERYVSTAEERRARHILIQVSSDAPPAKVEEARKKIEELASRLKRGESFEALAKRYSQDPGSADNGGDLGYFGRGVMDKTFEQAVFALKVGEVSAPVRSAFGFHLIQLEDIRKAASQPFDAVREQLKQEIQRQQAEQLYYQQAEQLANLAFEHPDTLANAAMSLHLPIQTSAFFTRDAGTGIAASPKVRSAAFSDDVLNGNNNSESVELAADHVVVLHLKRHQPAAVRPLDAVREVIRQTLRVEEAGAKAQAAGKALIKRAQQGTDPNKLAQEAGTVWNRVGYVARGDTHLKSDVIESAFRLGYPSPGKPLFDGKLLPNGDYVVFAVFAVKNGDVNRVAPDSRRKVIDALARANGEEEYADYVEILKAKSHIDRYPDKL